MLDGLPNDLLELGHTMKDTTADLLFRNVAEEPLDHVEPRSAGWRKVQMKPLVPSQPTQHRGMLVGAVIVGDQMNLLCTGSFSVDLLQELQPLLMAVSLHACTDHFAIQSVEVGFGDDRSFTANDNKATYRTSLQMIIDPKSGGIVRQVAKPGISEVGLTKPLVSLQGSTTLSGGTSTDKDGVHHYGFYITGLNGFSALNTFGTIDFNVNMSVDASGKIAVDSDTSRTKGFPSIEGFAYKMIQGELGVQILFKVEEQNPSKLNGPMDVPLTPAPK